MRELLASGLLVSASVYHHTSGSFLRSSLGCRLGLGLGLGSGSGLGLGLGLRPGFGFGFGLVLEVEPGVALGELLAPRADIARGREVLGGHRPHLHLLAKLARAERREGALERLQRAAQRRAHLDRVRVRVRVR